MCKTQVYAKKYPIIVQISDQKLSKVPPKYLALLENAKKKLISFKSTFGNTNIPIWINFEGISTECLVIM